MNHGGKCEVPANCSEHALGRRPARSFHSCGYGGAIYTNQTRIARGNVRPSRGEHRFSHSQSAGRRRRADSATDRLTGLTAASLATVGDLRLALGMKHPHDVIDQMDLDLAMSGVFRAVPLLPDQKNWDEFKSLQTVPPCWSVLGHTGVRWQRGEQSSCK